MSRIIGGLIALSIISSGISAQSISSMNSAPAKRNFAVIGIKGSEGVSQGEADIIADRLRSELFNTGVVAMMEREQMQEIMKEQGFQQSGACTDEACMVQMGKVLGVQDLVAGSIGKLGSMYLVNLRTVDVATAKVERVVSVDVNGGIEDVVGHLPEIARQLVGADSTKKIETGEKKEEKVVEKEEPAPKQDTVVPPPPPAKEETPAPAPEENSWKAKNKNRTGIRLGLYLAPWGVRAHFPGTRDTAHIQFANPDSFGHVYDSSSLNSYNYQNQISSKTDNMWFYPYVQASIRVGKFVAIDAGFQLAIGHIEYRHVLVRGSDLLGTTLTEASIGNLRYTYVAPGAAFGVNFTKRFFPVKLNAGILGDFSLPFSKKSFTPDSSGSSGLNSVTANDSHGIGFGYGLGARIGFEILPSTHFGFTFDARLRWGTYSTTDLLSSYNDDIVMWPLQFGAGVVFYP